MIKVKKNNKFFPVPTNFAYSVTSSIFMPGSVQAASRNSCHTYLPI